MALKIFASFFKVGLFTFGGGYAMLPVLMDEVVKRRAWFSEDDVVEGYALAQLSMGIIAINTAALIVARRFSRTLAWVAAFATMFPSIIILTLIGLFLNNAQINSTWSMIFMSVQIGVGVLIGLTVWGLFTKSTPSPLGILLLFGVLVLFLVFNASALLIVSSAIIISVFWGHKL